MKVSDYITHFFINKGIDTVFVMTGGAIAHIIDSVGEQKDKIKYICVQNEQVAAMAAEAYSRSGEANGVAMVTSGPGATNLITGIVGAWYDCIPAIYISGQVRTWELTGTKSTLQDGFQEVDICSQIKNVTKYTKTIMNKSDVPLELEKAYQMANSGRKGPVLLDFPMDIQWDILSKEEINRGELYKVDTEPNKIEEHKVSEAVSLFKNSKKPLILIGGGVKHARIKKYFNEFILNSNIPCVSTYAAYEILEYSNEKNIGVLGQFGQYCANEAIEDCDLLLALGTRFTIRASGNDTGLFASNAKVIHVNIDKGELKDSRKSADLSIHSDIEIFLRAVDGKIKCNDKEWLNYLMESKKMDLEINDKGTGINVNPYLLVEKLNEKMRNDSIIIPDVGFQVTTLNQQIKFKSNQQMFSSWANSPMGYAVAAGIGAYYANKEKDIIIHIGDGGFQVNLQDLQTLKNYNIPLKIILWNNSGYATIQAFQEGNLDSRYHATDYKNGYSNPNFKELAKLYGLKYFLAEQDNEVDNVISDVLEHQGPILCEIKMDINFRPKPSLGANSKFNQLEPNLNVQV